MKTYLSAIVSLITLLFLVSCGNEQFGTAATKDSSSADTLKSYEQSTCSTYTLIKPKVDILYAVDNSTSTLYVADDIKTAVRNTIDTVSQQFDYRVIGMPLLGSGTSTYQVLTNSTDALPEPSKTVISSSQLDFFSNLYQGSQEQGFSRVTGFINAHSPTSSTPLFRKGAYLLVVLISNGRDTDVEQVTMSNGETTFNSTNYTNYYNAFTAIKSNLQLEQLRFFAVTAKTEGCKAGWLSSTKSYIKMANSLYTYSGATDSSSNQDAYDLCTNGLSSLFTAVNNSIKQIVIAHTYRYWPITFLSDSDSISNYQGITVYKISNNVASVLPSTAWTYQANPNYPNALQIQEPITGDGELVSGKHFIKFTDGNLITYPDCVQIKSTSKTEYFKYIVIQKAMSTTTVAVVRVNGTAIPTTAWSYVGNQSNVNIKADYPNTGDQYPAIIKSGFMIQITDPKYYYKSGDTVDVSYTGSGI